MIEPMINAKRRRNGKVIEEWDFPFSQQWVTDDPRFAERCRNHNDHIRLFNEDRGSVTIQLKWGTDRVVVYGWHFDLLKQKAKRLPIVFRPIFMDGSLGGIGIASRFDGQYIETEDSCGIIHGDGIDDWLMTCWIKQGRDGSGDWKLISKPNFIVGARFEYGVAR